MSHRLTIGIDPGFTGAIGVLADGVFADVIDMPTCGRGKAGKRAVNAAYLASYLREQIAGHSGAYVHGVVEAVGSMPRQGLASTFRFGQSHGCVLGVLAALRIPVLQVTPQVWKRSYSLIGCDKEASRALAIDRFPDAPLSRKRDDGRAEALLLAHWGFRTEIAGNAPAAA